MRVVGGVQGVGVGVGVVGSYGSIISAPPTSRPPPLSLPNSAQHVQTNSEAEQGNPPSSKNPPVDVGGDKGDSLNVFLTITIISVSLYASYYLWKRHRKRRISISKLEDYRYSRLSQNEIEVDNMAFNNPLSMGSSDPHHQGHNSLNGEPSDDFGSLGDFGEFDDRKLSPATLHVEMDSSKEAKTSPSILDELSDEDLLQ